MFVTAAYCWSPYSVVISMFLPLPGHAIPCSHILWPGVAVQLLAVVSSESTSSRALSFLQQVVWMPLFVPLSLTHYNPAERPLPVQHKATEQHESCPWQTDMSFERTSTTTMSQAPALADRQGQILYNCPLQHLPRTTLKHLHCSILVTALEEQL